MTLKQQKVSLNFFLLYVGTAVRGKVGSDVENLHNPIKERQKVMKIQVIHARFG
jgi:hypothetical protein